MGWGAIVYMSLFGSEIDKYFSDKIHPTVGDWSTTIGFTILNYIIPWCLSKITALEKWDFASTQLKHEVWRTYLASILNVVLFTLLYAETLLDRPLFRDRPLNDIDSFNTRSNIRY